MQTQTRRHMIVIEDYDHVITKCEVDETNTLIVNLFSKA